MGQKPQGSGSKVSVVAGPTQAQPAPEELRERRRFPRGFAPLHVIEDQSDAGLLEFLALLQERRADNQAS